MEPLTTVWTKQHESVLETLQRTGRYAAKRSFIIKDLEEHAHLVLEVYDWLAAHIPGARPADAEYPVWLSYHQAAAMLPSPGAVILELSIPTRLITPVNIEKWGAMLNYSYIPSSPRDADRHRRLLAAYGVSDAKAYLTQFYPDIKREIVSSWDRLFDDGILLGSAAAYGTTWELRREWLRGYGKDGACVSMT